MAFVFFFKSRRRNTILDCDWSSEVFSPDLTDQPIPGGGVNNFVIKRLYTATDACGNSSSLTQTITVNDNTAPVISSIPADVTVQCASDIPAANDSAVVATDNCGGAPVITHSDQTIPGPCVNNFVIKRSY